MQSNDTEVVMHGIAAGRIQVLYVVPEHHMDMERAMIEAFGRGGLGTVVANSTEEVMTRLNNDELPLPQVIVMVEHGFSWDRTPLMRRIRRHHRAHSVPIIALSNNADPTLRSGVLKAAGANEVHLVPIRPAVLIASIKALANQPSGI